MDNTEKLKKKIADQNLYRNIIRGCQLVPIAK